MNDQNQRADALFDKLSKEKKQKRRKIIRTVAIILLVIALALVTTVILLRKNVEKRFASAAAEVQEYTVTTGTIHTIVDGSGILTEEDVETIDVPAGVEVTELISEAGDAVSAGDLIATVDLATVMTALSDVQDQLEDLDDQISEAKGDEASSYIRAGVSGRVKQIFGQKDMDVSLCMAENGALAIVSLDGYLAVDIETDRLTKGQEVTVTRGDDNSILGTVESAAGNRATILVTDNGPRVDEEVTVSLGSTVLGTGKLYIHNPLSVMGYAGTISAVSVKENAKVDPYTTIFQLKNTKFSANYDTLLRSRTDLEEDLMQLLTIYRDGAVLCPMDGRISSVLYDEETASTSTVTELVNLYPDKVMTITISVDETDILALEEDQAAEITVSSVSDSEVFPGTVTKISKVADTSTGVTQYSAEVTLEKAYGMLAGMTADVDIQIQGVENALIIPIDALHQTRDMYFVYTAYDEETKQYGGRKEVTIGMQNDTQVEILSGLNEGDKIYYTEASDNPFAAFMGMGGGMGMGAGMGGRPSGMGSGGSRPSGMPSGMPNMSRGG